MPEPGIANNSPVSGADKRAPAVSIGMPVYNGERYISEALDSLLAQTFVNFELIISDNASTDDTERICLEYASRDARIRYIRQDTNKGAASNFKYVLEGAVGTFFMWAAYDDMWESNWLEALVAEINPTDIAVRGLAKITNSAGELIGIPSVKSFKEMDILRVFFDDERNGKAFHIYSLFWKDRLLSVPFDILESEIYAADVIFIFQLVQYGNLRCVGKTSQYFRSHDMSTGAIQTNNQNSLRRLICLAHNLSFYRSHVEAAPQKQKILMILLSPVKMAKTQIELWFRGFMYIAFRSKKP